MKDKSIHPLKPRVVNTIEGINGNGLVKTEDKLFFDTVKQLISQFRKNFDASQDGGEQQKRENEFIDFTYLRLSKQLEKLKLETVDYKKIINEGFEALGPELNHDVDVKIREIIEQAIQKYFQEHKETRKSQVLTEVDTDKEIEKLSGDEKLLKVLDDLFGKDEKFKEQTEKQRQQQEEFNKELLKTFKNNLVKYSDSIRRQYETNLKAQQSNTVGNPTLGTNPNNDGKKKKRWELPITSDLDNILKKIDRKRFSKKGRKAFKNDHYRRLIQKYIDEHQDNQEVKNVIPKAFDTINNVQPDKNDASSKVKSSVATPVNQILTLGMIRSVDDSETQESSSELVTKYYNNAKRLYTFRNIKKFFSWSAKAFSMMLMPLKIVAKPFMKLKNILENVAKNLLGITKMLIDRSLNFLITPAGIYAVGFTIGLVVGFIKQKLKFNDEDGEESFLSKFINGIRYFYDNVVTPVFEIAKNLFEITYNIVSRVVKFCVKHPKLTLFMLGAIKFLENIKGIKTTVNIAKMIGGSPFNAILGIGASLATEAIMGGLFKSKSEDGMQLTIKSLKNVEFASKFINRSVEADLNSSDLKKYSEINERINNEYSEVQLMTQDLDTLIALKIDNSKEKYESETLEENLGDTFLRRVYDSYVFDFDQKGYKNFKERMNSMTLDSQINEILDYLKQRANKIVILKSAFQESTLTSEGDPRDKLSLLINRIYKKDGKVDSSVFADNGRDPILGRMSNLIKSDLSEGGVRNAGLKLMSNALNVKQSKYNQTIGSHIIARGEVEDSTSWWESSLQKKNFVSGYRYAKGNGNRTLPDNILRTNGLEEKLWEKYKKSDGEEQDAFKMLEAEDIVEKFGKGFEKKDIDRMIDELIYEKSQKIKEQREQKRNEHVAAQTILLEEQDKDIKDLEKHRDGLKEDIAELKKRKGVRD